VGALAYFAAWIIIPEEPLLLAAPAPPSADKVVNT
jgi:hypothetical protein